MSSRDKYVEDLKRKIDEWNAEISAAELRMKSASDQAKARYAEQIAEMKKRRAEAEAKVRDALQKSTDEWENLRRDFEGAWHEIAEGFSRAWSRLQ